MWSGGAPVFVKSKCIQTDARPGMGACLPCNFQKTVAKYLIALNDIKPFSTRFTIHLKKNTTDESVSDVTKIQTIKILNNKINTIK